MLRFAISAIVLSLIVSAQPQDDDALRNADAAVARGDYDLALRHLDAARLNTADPGLVSYQRGCVLALQSRWNDATVEFTRSLDDADAPLTRKARAHYNRGIAGLNAEESIVSIRGAIADFHACLSITTEDALRKDAGYNLEAAKIRWLKWQAKQDKRTPPDDGSASTDPKTNTDSTTGTDGNANPNPNAKATPVKSGNATNGTAANGNPKGPPMPGAGSLPVIKDDSVLVPLTPQQTDAYLEQTAQRLLQQRRMNERLRTGPERNHARDW